MLRYQGVFGEDNFHGMVSCTRCPAWFRNSGRHLLCPHCSQQCENHIPLEQGHLLSIPRNAGMLHRFLNLCAAFLRPLNFRDVRQRYLQLLPNFWPFPVHLMCLGIFFVSVSRNPQIHSVNFFVHQQIFAKEKPLQWLHDQGPDIVQIGSLT